VVTLVLNIAAFIAVTSELLVEAVFACFSIARGALGAF
jgi:hypothetical protein